MDRATPDIDAFASVLRTCGLCERGVPTAVARAPGRLDVMGGIADYSGSLVLQRPIAEAAWAAVQPGDRPALDLVSIGRPPLSVSLEAVAPDGVPIGYDEARRMFRGDQHWAAYVAGVLLVLARERAVPLRSGLRIVVWSTVPEGKGVSSSAAVEVASMGAVARALGCALTGRELALFCQRAENMVAGAPCGVMDQMTSVFGEPDHLMALLCQPAELQPPVPVPPDLAFWGIDSGERHAIGGPPRASHSGEPTGPPQASWNSESTGPPRANHSGESRGTDYGAVRTGAFMGLRLLRVEERLSAEYLADLQPEEFERRLRRYLPEEIAGDVFLARYGPTSDTVTTVEPWRRYPVAAPTAHPVYERARAEEFRRLLAGRPDEAACVRLGELMYESHASYGRCGLGSPGTDRLVALVRREGATAGVYGARITGGGSGGTVAVLGRRDAAAAIARIADAYERDTGHRPQVFAGSSPGALAFGGQTIVL